MKPLLIGLVVVLVVAGIIYGAVAAKQRLQAMATWAHKQGFPYAPQRDHTFDSIYSQFSSLRQGSNHYAFNIIHGRRSERGLIVFDYHYEMCSTSSKGHRQTHHHTFTALMIDAGLPLKPLLIRPEGFFDKVTEFFGYADIDFESAEFSRSFFVKSLDKKWAFDVISQKTMEFMLAQPRFTMYFGNPSITVCRNKRLGVKDIEAAWGLIAGILDRLPQYLLREFKRG